MTETTEIGLQVSAGEGIEVWKMNSPPVNPLNRAILKELREAVARVDQDSGISAIVLTSALPVFSAGADAAEMVQAVLEHGADKLVDQFNEVMDQFRELCISIRRSPCLFVAALNGHTLAGGLELASACDLRFAANVDRLRIGVPEMDLFGALPSGGGGAQFITRLMGPSRALLFILNARPVSPVEAYELGLVDRLCNPATMLQDAQGFAAAVAKKAGRIGVVAAKRAILGGAELALHEALEMEHSVHWDAMRRGNFRNGVAAFTSRYGARK
jgi:enoyl-CoA hydratase